MIESQRIAYGVAARCVPVREKGPAERIQAGVRPRQRGYCIQGPTKVHSRGIVSGSLGLAHDRIVQGAPSRPAFRTVPVLAALDRERQHHGHGGSVYARPLGLVPVVAVPWAQAFRPATPTCSWSAVQNRIWP